MNTTFSFKRIGYILRADLIEYKMYALLSSVAGLIAWGLLNYSTTTNFIPLFYFVLMILTVNYCSYVGRKLHKPTGLFLTLPASTAEKYVALLLEGLLFLIAYNLFFMVGSGIGRLLSGSPMVEYHELYGALSVAKVLTALFFSSLLLFFYVTFRKMVLMLYLIACVLTIGFIINVVVKIAFSMMDPNGNVHLDTDAALAPFYNLYEYYIAAVCMATAGCFYLVYYKLKNKQLR